MSDDADGRPLRRVVIREEFVAVTGGFQEALVLGQMLYWAERCHDIDAWVAEERARRATSTLPVDGLEPTHGWVYKTSEQLAAELMTGWDASTVRRYLANLVKAGFLAERHNPLHRWDRTMQYRVDLVRLSDALERAGYHLEGWLLPSRKMPDASGTTQDASCKTQDRKPQDAAAIPETTNKKRATPLSGRACAASGNGHEPHKPEAPTHACPHCGKLVASKGALTSHLRRDHGDGHEHEAVAAYRDATKCSPNQQQRAAIAATVTDLPRWRGTLDEWMLHRWKPTNVAGMLDHYGRSSSTAAALAQVKPANLPHGFNNMTNDEFGAWLLEHGTAGEYAAWSEGRELTSSL